MKFKKLLGIISIVIVVVFSMMLTTSYAWYAFDNASTVFEGMTNNDDIIVSYQKGEYINVTNAIPITQEQVDMYSEKNNFNIKVKNNVKGNEMLVSISLVEIGIDGSLLKNSFKVELYHQSEKVADIGGNSMTSVTKKLADVVLDNDITNNFELRLYILDDGTDQSTMENKTFQAKIKVDVISRLKTNLNDYNNADINISSVTIDGEESNYIPTEGYYNMSSSCTKAGENSLEWDPLSKTITYSGGSYINDNCSLTFTSSTDYPLLSEMEPGSYVKYTGTNGCDGIHCEGYNANYVSDNDMGYCSSTNYKFHVNGWRIAYVEDGSAHLVSAGAPECVNTAIYSKSTSTSLVTMSSNYYYGSGYEFNEETGSFSLTGVTSSTLSWSSNYNSIIENTPYTCISTSKAGTCNQLYEMISYDSSTGKGNVYYHYGYETTTGVPIHLSKMSSIALKYCDKDYIKGGVCDENTSWAMNASDFRKITGTVLNSSSCFGADVPNKYACGYTNDLIDIGVNYWFATLYSSASRSVFIWDAGFQGVTSVYSLSYHGVRPVLVLESSIRVISGGGTYEDPYIISKFES